MVEDERGIIDNNATVKFRNFNAKVDYSPTDRVQAFFRTGYFGEDRGNGKILEVNDTRWTVGERRRAVPAAGRERAAGERPRRFRRLSQQLLRGDSAVSDGGAAKYRPLDDRSGRPDQGGRRPSSSGRRRLARKQYFSAGTDWHWVDGDSEEDGYNAAPGPVVPPVQNAVLALRRISGGTQRTAGFFLQDILTPLPKLTLTLSGRVDSWRNYDGHNLENNVPSGTPTANNRLLPDKDDTVFSPRVGGDVPRHRSRQRLGRPRAPGSARRR